MMLMLILRAPSTKTEMLLEMFLKMFHPGNRASLFVWRTFHSSPSHMNTSQLGVRRELCSRASPVSQAYKKRPLEIWTQSNGNNMSLLHIKRNENSFNKLNWNNSKSKNKSRNLFCILQYLFDFGDFNLC